MTTFREESEEHVVHRLEAFSDIVIGFSLAQMTLSLILPSDVATLFGKHSITFAAFGTTFAVVAGMWWAHHRLFTHYFVPTAPNIMLNFCSLGGVMFLVYSLQVWLHARTHLYLAYAMYAGAIAWIMLIIAFLTYRGVALRGARMAPETASRGRRAALKNGVIGLAFGAVAVLSPLLHGAPQVTGLIFLGGAALTVAMRLAQAISRNRRRPASE